MTPPYYKKRKQVKYCQQYQNHMIFFLTGLQPKTLVVVITTIVLPGIKLIQSREGKVSLRCIISTLCSLYPAVHVTWYNLASVGKYRRLRLPPPQENYVLIDVHRHGNRPWLNLSVKPQESLLLRLYSTWTHWDNFHHYHWINWSAVSSPDSRRSLEKFNSDIRRRETLANASTKTKALRDFNKCGYLHNYSPESDHHCHT